jgi:CheY-like chemotaxis protein
VASVEGQGSQPALEPLPGGSEHIVFIDDDPFLVDIGTEIIEGLGYRVTSFSQSPEALAYLSAHARQVDLVVTDLTMPKLTGIDLAKALHTQQAQIPVLLCTGHNEGLTGEDLQSIGIETIILKPITMHNLALQVRAALDRDKPSPV